MKLAVLLILAAAVYFLPLLVAMARREADRTQILIVNLFFGWSILGWVIALALAAGLRPGFPIAAALPNALQKLPSWLLAASLLLASLWLLHSPAGAQQSNLPSEPTGFSASRGTTHRQALLAWQRPESDGGSPITSFVIHYAKNNRFTRSLETVQVTDVDSASSRFAKKIPGLDQGTRYYFRVAAVNANGQGAWSATKNATPRSVITVAAVNKTITEGDAAEFRVRLWPAPRSNTRVAVEITVEGRFGLNSRSRNVTVRRNQNSATLTIRTTNDTSHEPDGLITARVRGQRGYAVGNPRTANVRINDDDNGPPAFAADTDTRSIAENTAAATNIGDPVTATDPDSGDTLTYSLSGADAASFTIVSSNGQLQTKAALDYETKSAYAVTVTASDGSLSDTVDVTINVINVNEPPAFAADTDTRSIAENTAAATNIGDPVTATDPDSGDTLTYSLSGADAASFTIVSSNGQLQTKAALDYETKSAYAVTVTASDGSLSDTIDVTINVTGVPGQPIAIEADRGTTHRQVLLAWQRPESDGGSPITHYVINYAENTRFTQNAATVQTAAVVGNPSRLTHRIPGLDQGTRYYFRVAAVNANGQGAWSATENATPRSVITVAAVNKTITEGDAAEFRVRLWPAPRSNTRVVVEITTEGSYGVNARNRNVTVRRNENSATLTIRTTNDTSHEPDGSITARVQGQSGYAVGSPRTAKITIEDNDEPQTVRSVVTIAAVHATITEGADAQFQITFNPASQADTRVAVEISVKGDYGVSESERTATVTAGQTGATLSLPTDDDAADEPDGSISVRLAQGQSGYDVGASNTATVLISDNDEPVPTPTPTPTPTPIPVNSAPTVNGSAAVDYAENGTADVATYTVTDPDAGSTHTWTLAGTDAAAFSISDAGVLTFNASPDYETKSSYEVTVTATDNGSPALSDSIPVTVNVTNVNEAPVFFFDVLGPSVPENAAPGTVVYTITATDPDAGDVLSYTLTGSDAFTVDSSSGQIKVADSATLDYETTSRYTLTLTATDSGGLSDTMIVLIDVTNVNEPPTVSGNAAVDYAENGTDDVAIYSVSDPDASSTHDWSLEGTDAASFTISDNGVLTFNAPPDYETKSSYAVTVKATDNGSPALSGSLSVTVSITDVNENEPPIVSGNGTVDYAENGAGAVATYTVTDPDAGSTHIWSLEGTDAASFSISDNGVLTFNAPPDYETKSSYAVTVKATDNGDPPLSDSIAVTITVIAVNEAPAFASDTLSLSVPENTPAGTSVGAVTATDPDAGDVLSYTFNVSDAFIVDGSGQIKVADGATLDFETTPSYTVTVTASDSGGLTDTVTVTITVTDVNEPPAFSSETLDLSVSEHAAAGTVVHSLTATDPDAGDVLSYTFNVSDAFIVDGSGQIKVADGATLDFETTPSYTVTVTASDSGGLTDTVTVTITVTDVAEPPLAPTSLAVAAQGATVLRATWAAPDNTGRPAITSYDVQYRTGASGEWSDGPQDVAVPTADVGSLTPNTAYQVRVRAGNADGDGAWTSPVSQTTAALTAPAAPTSLSAAAAGWSQIDLSWTAPAAHPDRAAVTDYTLEWSADGNDPWTALATITDAATTTYSHTDLVSETTRHYRVRAASSAGDGEWSTTASATTAANSAPSFSYEYLNIRVSENTAPGTVVGDSPLPAASDPDNDTLTYTLSAGTYPEPSFTMDANRRVTVQAGASLDYESRPLYVLTLTVTDPGGLSASVQVFFFIDDVNENEPPTVSGNAAVDFAENGDGDVATYTATDPDSDSTHTWSVEGTDADSFTISGGVLRFKTPPDYEAKTAYTVTVKATDNGDPPLSDSLAVTISITDVAPSYRQVRTWTGRNSDNTADVTLTTYGTWGTSSTPQKAPDITSTTSTETRTADSKVRKTITWTDGTNKAFQRTDWYFPTRTETYTETVYYDRTQYRWKGVFFVQLPGWTPENPNENWELKYTYGRWSYKNPPPEAPYPPLEPGEIITNPSTTEELQTRTVQNSRQEQRTRTVTVTPVYAPTSGPTENASTIESEERP